MNSEFEPLEQRNCTLKETVSLYIKWNQEDK